MHMFMDYVPDVSAFKKLSFKNAASYICTGKMSRARPFYVPQFTALKALTDPSEHARLKITMCAPEWYHLRHGVHAYPKDVYADDDAYFDDVALAYQQEIQELYAAGCRHIQIDDPLLAYFCAESMIKGMEEEGVDHEALLDTYIRAYNECLKGRPADMTVGLHLCRGNFKVCAGPLYVVVCCLTALFRMAGTSARAATTASRSSCSSRSMSTHTTSSTTPLVREPLSLSSSCPRTRPSFWASSRQSWLQYASQIPLWIYASVLTFAFPSLKIRRY